MFAICFTKTMKWLIRGVAANSGLWEGGSKFKTGPSSSLMLLHHANNIEHNIQPCIFTISFDYALIHTITHSFPKTGVESC